MALLALLGGFLAVAAGIAALVIYIRGKIRSFSNSTFGNPDLLDALRDIDTVGTESPRSLNGCDTLLLPQILQDFPDFDINLAKTYVRDELRRRNAGKKDFVIHNVVICRYLRSGAQKTIVFQAATCYRDDALVQQRFDLHYTYILPDETNFVAANCPNCGGALGFGVRVCPYCDSRVANVLGNTWEFTEVKES